MNRQLDSHIYSQTTLQTTPRMTAKMTAEVTAQMPRHMHWAWLFLLAMSILLLSGCNSMRIIESQVQTSTQWPTGTASQFAAPAKAFFRHDRLPADVNSLQAGWAEVELEAALKPLGWTRNDIEAQYSVWIGVRAAEFIADPWGRPVRSPWFNRFNMNIGTGYRPNSVGLGVGWGVGMNTGMRPIFPPPSGYAQEVSIIIRDLKTSNVVYQTKAAHDGPWSDHQNILRVMIGAALQGFPNPSAPNRRVDTTIAR
jgi:hypothetical protein